MIPRAASQSEPNEGTMSEQNINTWREDSTRELQGGAH